MQAKAAQPLEEVVRIIRDAKDAAAVRTAIIDLGYEKGADVYPVLVGKLDDPNPAIQHAAVLSLGRYGNPAAIAELVKPKVFRSPAPNIRQAAVAAVGALGDYRVIDHLLKAVDDAEWIVRTQAVTELMGKVREILDKRDPRLIRVLINMMSLENAEIVDLAVDGFKEFGVESLPLLHEALNNSSASIRAHAARAVGSLRSRLSGPHLLALLKDGEWQVRAEAAEALGRIADKRALEPLILSLQDNVGRVQEEAASAIVRYGREATFPLLNALARERDKFALRAMLLALGKIGDPKSAPALIAHLRSSYFIVRQAAVTALVRFGPQVVDMLLPTLSFNCAIIGPMIKDASDRRHPELQIRAIKGIGGLEDHCAVNLLKELLEDGLPDVQEAASAALAQIGCAAWGRCCAIKVLAEVGGAALSPTIAPSLGDDSDNVRFEAVRALGKWGGPEAVRLLAGVARKDRAGFIRTEAVRVLRTIGAGHPDVLDVALAGLKDKAREVRSQSARLLGISHDRKSILPLLKAMADPHWSVRESSENALLNFGSDAVRPLLAALASQVWTTRFRAARLLGELGDASAAPGLEKLLARKGERNEVRVVIIAALGKLKTKRTA